MQLTIDPIVMTFEMDENGLPVILEPAFDWLATKLPPSLVDNVIVPGLGHVFALGHSLYDVVLGVASQRPGAWDAEKILPPIITLFGAYLALLSFYRTTSWMVRTTLWFAKWGSLFGALVGGAGYLAGQQGGAGGVLGGLQDVLGGGAGGMARMVGAKLWDVINAPGNDAPRTRSRSKARTTGNTGADRQTRSSTKSSSKTSSKTKDKSRAASEPAPEPRAQPGGDAQKIMGDIVGFAEKMGWMGALRGAFGGGADDDDERR
jgi:hypothetical protein